MLALLRLRCWDRELGFLGEGQLGEGLVAGAGERECGIRAMP